MATQEPEELVRAFPRVDYILGRNEATRKGGCWRIHASRASWLRAPLLFLAGGFVLATLVGGASPVPSDPAPADVEVAAAFYPYHRKLRVRIDLSRLPTRQRVSRAEIRLSGPDEAAVLASAPCIRFGPPPRQRNAPVTAEAWIGEVVMETPDLPDGVYSVSVRLAGGLGVPAGPFRTRFQRKRWEWERNRLGRSRRVIPPFTPLRVLRAARQLDVETILRSHRMNPHGLWDRVRSRGQEILAAPLRFEARSGGRPVRWRAEPLRLVEESPDRVVARAAYSGGGLSARVTSEIEYDGMMKVTLDLPATGAEIESLTLALPLKTSAARLMHVVGDSIRENFAGGIPRGKGVVWTSKGANGKGHRYGGLYGTFMPYVWLGGPERGLCWFADTDRDWSLDDEGPALDVVRREDRVTLRVHLFNRRTRLDRPRRIVFGLQATPVKPLPVEPDGRSWRSWWFTGGRPPNAVTFSLFGNTLMWGGQEGMTDIYPRRRDTAIFREFARARRIGNAHIAWVDESGWLDGYPDQTRRTEYRSNVVAGLASLESDRIVLYTDARGGEDNRSPESRSFNVPPLTGNEWDEPKESYQDFALFHFRKMLETGAIDGIYLDNLYPTGNWDPVSSEAYVREDGTLQPSVGIFRLREYARRLATLFHETGRTPYTVAHMTNACLVPVLSFATIGLDWEDRYGPKPFQEKFPGEYLLTESLGLQAGVVPVGLGGVTGLGPDDPEFTRLSRTQIGVALIHEVKLWGAIDGNAVLRAWKPLFELGYGLPDCRVYRFWDTPSAVTVTAGAARTLVLARGGRALLAVTDVGGGGTAALRVDAHTLGLRPGFSARDAESGEPLPVSKGRLRLPLARYDFRLITLE